MDLNIHMRCIEETIEIKIKIIILNSNSIDVARPIWVQRKVLL